MAIGLAAAGVAWFLATHPGGENPRRVAYTLSLVDQVPTGAEIAFFGNRVAKNPALFIEQNILAAAYLKRARETGDPSFFDKAGLAAAASLKAMPRQNPDAEKALALVAVAHHRFNEARTLAQQVQARYPQADMRSLMATIDLAQGRTREARTRLEAVVASAPSTSTWAQLGLTLAACGDDQQALSAFDRAIEIEQAGDLSASADARTWLGRLQLRRGRLLEAEALVKEAIRIQPGHGQAWGIAGDIAARWGKLEEADQQWKRAGELRHDSAPALARARIAMAADRPADAEALWTLTEKTLRADMALGHMDHRRELARLLLDRDQVADVREAVRLLAAERAVREDAETLDLHAWALLRSDDAEGAQAALDKLAATGAREAPFMLRAARVARARGDTARADEWVREADLLDPTFRADPAYAPFDVAQSR